MNAIRDLTKSMTSYAWAMSVYGVQQMFSLMSPQKASESFDKVTGATVNEMGHALRDTFLVGDRIQRGMVDMMMGSLSMFGMDPGEWAKRASSMLQQSVDATQRAAQATADAAQRATGSATPGFQSAPPRHDAPAGCASQAMTDPSAPAPSGAGWGPMPK